IGEIALDALFNGELVVLKPILQIPLLGFGRAAGVIQAHTLVVGFNWRNLMEEVAQAIRLEAAERAELHLDEVRQGQLRGQTGVRFGGKSLRHSAPPKRVYNEKKTSRSQFHKGRPVCDR